KGSRLFLYPDPKGWKQTNMFYAPLGEGARTKAGFFTPILKGGNKLNDIGFEGRVRIALMKKDDMQDKDGMWKGAAKESFIKARILRDNMTESEKVLWERLSKNQSEGLKFRRQHPILFYIADFYCHALRLIIEIDGGYHDTVEQKIKDDERTEHLKSNGITLIRFTNEGVLNNINGV